MNFISSIFDKLHKCPDKKAYMVQSLDAHPDKGGSENAMSELNDVYSEVKNIRSGSEYPDENVNYTAEDLDESSEKYKEKKLEFDAFIKSEETKNNILNGAGLFNSHVRSLDEKVVPVKYDCTDIYKSDVPHEEKEFEYDGIVHNNNGKYIDNLGDNSHDTPDVFTVSKSCGPSDGLVGYSIDSAYNTTSALKVTESESDYTKRTNPNVDAEFQNRSALYSRISTDVDYKLYDENADADLFGKFRRIDSDIRFEEFM